MTVPNNPLIWLSDKLARGFSETSMGYQAVALCLISLMRSWFTGWVAKAEERTVPTTANLNILG